MTTFLDWLRRTFDSSLTSYAATVEKVLESLIIIFPLPTLTSSLKRIKSLLFTGTDRASSAGTNSFASGAEDAAAIRTSVPDAEAANAPAALTDCMTSKAAKAPVNL